MVAYFDDGRLIRVLTTRLRNRPDPNQETNDNVVQYPGA